MAEVTESMYTQGSTCLLFVIYCLLLRYVKRDAPQLFYYIVYCCFNKTSLLSIN